jgi:hypothetical protein
MKSVEFCYWLQGFFEINSAMPPGGALEPRGLTAAQTETIRRHLHLVFKHEIDPSYPNGAALDAIHNPPPKVATPQPSHVAWPDDGPSSMSDQIIRC